MLYMRTALDSAAVPGVLRDEDVSARGRIVASAMALFAEAGFRAATVREIAARADVSAALVTHHFGGKEALRRECDERALAFLDRKVTGGAGAAAILDDMLRQHGPYLARMLTDDSPAAHALFARLVEVARAAMDAGVAAGTLRPADDREAQAVTMVVLGLAPFFLLPHLASWTGGDAGAALTRLSVPLAAIYTHGFLTDGGLADAAAAFAAPTGAASTAAGATEQDAAR